MPYYKLDKRHERIKQMLKAHSPKLFSPEELSAKCNVSFNTLRNELPKMAAAGHVLREKKDGKFFYQHNPNKPTVVPLAQEEALELIAMNAWPNYTPKPVRLGWNFAQALLSAAHDGPWLDTVKELSDALTVFNDFLQRAMATPLSVDYLTSGLSEKNLEGFYRLRGELRAKLDSVGQGQTNTTPGDTDHD